MSGNSTFGRIDNVFSLCTIQQVVDAFLKKTKGKADAGDATAGIVGQLNLEEFASVLDNAPPGTDELVALSKVRRRILCAITMRSRVGMAATFSCGCLLNT